MTPDVYRKVMSDAMEISMFIREISLQGLGEPLMDKDIVFRVYMARQALPQVRITLYTNGALLTVDLAARLRGAGLSDLVVSLTGTSREERRGAMGLDDWDSVIEQVEMVRKILPTKVKLVASSDLVQNPLKFTEKWGSDTMVTWEGNWAGQLTKFRGSPHKQPCHRAMDQLMVLHNGDVSLCCFDGEGEMLFGNVMEKSLSDIWGGPERSLVRQQHKEGRRGEIDLCRNCTGI